MDIGDSAMVNQAQQLERKQCYEEDSYEKLSKGHKGHNKPQYEGGDYIAVGYDHDNGNKLKDKMTKRIGAMGHSNMTMFMDELERKINRKSAKKRHKSKVQENVPEIEQINEESYMTTMEEMLPDTESDVENAEALTKPIQTYTSAPMKVFVRRTHCEDEIIESDYNTNDGH